MHCRVLTFSTSHHFFLMPAHFYSGDISLCSERLGAVFSINNNNNNNNHLPQLGCYPVTVVILHVHKTWNWLLLNLSGEGYMRSM